MTLILPTHGYVMAFPLLQSSVISVNKVLCFSIKIYTFVIFIVSLCVCVCVCIVIVLFNGILCKITQQWPQDWKRSVFTPVPKKGNAKNAQTTAQLHSSHTLVK